MEGVMNKTFCKVLMLVSFLLLLQGAAYATCTDCDKYLTVNKTGTGDGTVGGAGSYPYNSTAYPTAVADAYSTFTNWSGDCSGTTSPASVYMSANRTCTATFTCLYYPYRIGGSIQSAGSVQDAYDNTPHNDTLDLQALSFSGDLLIDQDKTVVITGGYTCAFVSDSGLSTINTKIVISDGKAIVANIIIK
jgi:hypothetical protein